MASTSPKDDRFILLPWVEIGNKVYVRKNKRFEHSQCIVLFNAIENTYNIFVYNSKDHCISEGAARPSSLEEAKMIADKMATGIGFRCLKDKYRSML